VAPCGTAQAVPFHKTIGDIGDGFSIKATCTGKTPRARLAFLPFPASKVGEELSLPQAESPQETLQF
jgi:hypothetical protein